MPTDKELMDLLRSIWVDLGLGIVFVALGFAIIFSDWKPYFHNPIARRGKLLPVMLITYFLVLSSWTIMTIIHGRLILAGGLIAMGVLQVIAILYKYRLHRRMESTNQENSLGGY